MYTRIPNDDATREFLIKNHSFGNLALYAAQFTKGPARRVCSTIFKATTETYEKCLSHFNASRETKTFLGVSIAALIIVLIETFINWHSALALFIFMIICCIYNVIERTEQYHYQYHTGN